MTVHIGTHVDAPYHFLGQQAMTVEQIPLNVLNGRAYVLHVPDEINLITSEFLGVVEIPPRTRRILFKTRNSELWAAGVKEFQKDFVAISPDGAQYLVDRNIRLVGVDYLSVAPFTDGIPPHKILLKEGVVIVEGLDLSQVTQGRYTLHCLPLKIAGADGAPARAILVGV
jgi:arylformamidase